MKKRIFALALALCMLLSVMPTSFAAEGFLTLGGSEPAAEADSQTSTGVLTLGGTEEEDEEPTTGVLIPGGSFVEEEEPADEEQTEEPQPPTGVLYTQCAFCGYLDNTHADDCPTLQPEEEEVVEQPVVQPQQTTQQTQVTQAEITTKQVSNYTAETVSTQSTSGSERLTIQRNAMAYATLSASLMTLSEEDGIAAQADERVDNSSIVTNKTVSGPDADNAYTITLETFVTGQTTTTSTTVADAMDIILILDTSREMVEETYSTTEVWGSWQANGGNKSATVYKKANDEELYYKVGDNYYRVTVTQNSQGNNNNRYTATYYNGTINVTIDNFQSATYYVKTTTTTVTGSDNGATRLAALKTAAINFIDAIAPEGTTQNDRRVALISYNSSATVLTGEHDYGSPYVDENNAVDAALRPVATEKALLKAEINALKVDTSAAAYCETALYNAKQIFQDGNDTVPTNRPRIVILLSAGVFGPSGSLNKDGTNGDGYTAMDMIWLSVILKTARGTTAAPDFGSNFYGYADRDANSFLNTYGSYAGCGATVYCVGLGMPTTEPTGEYTTTGYGTIPSRINEVMYRVSSHRPDGTHTSKYIYNPWENFIGNSVHKDDDWEGTYPDALTRNVNKLNSAYTSYFLTADDASELSGIFETISDSITTGGASIELDESTTVVDVVSDYFVLPDGVDTDDIEVSMADCTDVDTSGDETEYSWASRSQLWPIDANTGDDINVSVELSGDDTVSVGGFDFSEYWVGKDSATNTVHGKKLIVVFKVYVADNFLGGENVPTNAGGSHIVNGDTVFEEFEPPVVNIPVNTSVDLDWATDVVVRNQTIYLSNSADLRDMLSIPTSDSLFNGVNNKFVEVTFEIGAATYTIAPGATSGAWSVNYSVAPVKCTDYEIICKINGVEVTYTEDGVVKTNSTTATVHVLKPEIVSADQNIYLGQTAPVNAAVDSWNCDVGCDDHSSKDKAVGTAPASSIMYSYESSNGVEVTAASVPADCGTYTATATLAGQNFSDTFVIHVWKPVVEAADKTIYLSQPLPVNAVVTDWACKDTNNTQKPEGDAPNASVVFTYEDENENAVTAETIPTDCGTYTAVGTLAGQKFTDAFTVHVLKPSFEITAPNIWADYAQNVDVDFYVTAAVTGWADATEVHTGIPAAQGDTPTNLTYTYTVKHGEDVVTAHSVGTTDETFTVELAGFKIGDLNCGTNWHKVPDAKSFTIHVNKFDLTINKDWDSDVEDCYKQDVIFTIVNNTTGSALKGQTIQVVIPKGKTSVKVVGLLCGQSYSVKEANTQGKNWAWRFTNKQNETASCGGHGITTSNPHVTSTYGADSINFTNNNPVTKWFDALANAFNIFGKGAN